MGKALDTSGVATGHPTSISATSLGLRAFMPTGHPGRSPEELGGSTHTLPWYPDGRLCQRPLRSGFPDPTSNF